MAAERAAVVERVAVIAAEYWRERAPQLGTRARELLTLHETEGQLIPWASGLELDKRETRLTRALAWLLDGRGSHGVGPRFLRAFLSECGVSSDLESPWRVKREHRFPSVDGDGEDEPDIVLLGPDSVVVIEHKLDAPESRPDQYDAYRKLTDSHWPTKRHRRLVFLRSGAPRRGDPTPLSPGVFNTVLGGADLRKICVGAAEGAPRRQRDLLAGFAATFGGAQEAATDLAARLRTLLGAGAAPPRLLAVMNSLRDHLQEPTE